MLADAYLVKSSEIGNCAPVHSRTHIGHLLHPGDLVLGFDIANTNLNEPNFERYEQNHHEKIPDVIVVKKYYGEKSVRNRRRQWRLKHLGLETDSQINQNDYYEFMEDLEEDPILRQNINIYKDTKKISNEMSIDSDDIIDDTCPQITLQEMLEDLTLE